MTSGDRADRGSVDDLRDPGDGPEGSGLNRAVQARIGEQLRAMYDGLMDQPVPDRFHALLARLGNTGGLEDQA